MRMRLAATQVLLYSTREKMGSVLCGSLVDFLEPPSHTWAQRTAPPQIQPSDALYHECLRKMDDQQRQAVDQENLRIIKTNQERLATLIGKLKALADEHGANARRCIKTDRKYAQQQFKMRKIALGNVDKFQRQHARLDEALLALHTNQIAMEIRDGMQETKAYLAKTCATDSIKAVNESIDDFAVTMSDADEINKALMQTPASGEQFTDDEINSELDAFISETSDLECAQFDAPGVTLPNAPTTEIGASAARQRHPEQPMVNAT